MTDVLDRHQVVGSVVCRCHGVGVDLLCTRCLARLTLPVDLPTLEHDGDRFLVEHAHTHRVPTHHWESDGTVCVDGAVGVVCDGSRRELEVAREVVRLALASGHPVRIVHPESPRWVTVPGDAATTLDAERFLTARRDGVLGLAAEFAGAVRVESRPASRLGAALQLAGDDDVSVVVLPPSDLPGRLLRWVVDRRAAHEGRTPPAVVVWRRGPDAAAALASHLGSLATGG
jgi:hypothetical protein